MGIFHKHTSRLKIQRMYKQARKLQDAQAEKLTSLQAEKLKS